jgi:hypothetical protein
LFQVIREVLKVSLSVFLKKKKKKKKKKENFITIYNASITSQ